MCKILLEYDIEFWKYLLINTFIIEIMYVISINRVCTKTNIIPYCKNFTSSFIEIIIELVVILNFKLI